MNNIEVVAANNSFTENFNLTDSICSTYDALVLFLNNSFEEAKRKLEPKSKVDFYHALGFATVNYLQAVITMDSQQISDASEAVKNCLSVCNKSRKKITITNSFKFRSKSAQLTEFSKYTDEQCHAELCYAECLLQKAFLTLVQDENMVALIKGSLKIRECYRTYKDCWNMLSVKVWNNDLNKSTFESGVRLGVGAFNLMISMLPTKILRLLEFVGFRGNKEFGLKEINKAASFENSLRQTMAKLLLLCYHSFVGVMIGLFPYDKHITESRGLIQSSLAKHKNSAIFKMFQGRVNLISGNFDEAIEGYESSIEAQNEWKNLHDICYWELLWCHILQSDWLLGMKYAERLSQHSRWSKTLYLYQKGVFLIECYSESSETMNDDSKNHLRRIFESVPKLTQRFAGKSLPAEKFAAKKSKRFFDQNEDLILPGVELLFIWNGFKILGHNQEYLKKIYDTIEKKLIAFKANNSETSNFYFDNLALILMLKSVALKYMKNNSEALNLMSEVMNLEKKIKEDIYILPYTEVEIAQMYFEKEDYVESKKHIENAKSYKSYSLHSRLHFRIHAINTLLRKALNEPTISESNSWMNENFNDSNFDEQFDFINDDFLDCKDDLSEDFFEDPENAESNN